jgi:hypothetical protein
MQGPCFKGNRVYETYYEEYGDLHFIHGSYISKIYMILTIFYFVQVVEVKMEWSSPKRKTKYDPIKRSINI